MDARSSPVAALRRIAYLLESEHAPTYKVRAFRRAAEVVDDAGDERLRALVASRRLTDLPGIGEATAAVVVAVLAGQTPSYLEALEVRSDSPRDPAVDALRASLRGDLHSHSAWSDGASSIEEMARAAAALGHDYLALTDHSPRLTVAHGLDADRLRRQLDRVQALNDELAPFRVLSGIEVDILLDGALDQDEELLARLDIVVASVHSKLRMDAEAMTARMVAAVRHPLTDVLGHCTGRLITARGRPASAFDADAVFSACAASGTAVEINSRPERRDPPDDLLRRAVELGCLFAIDTDAHAPGQLEWQHLGCEQAVDAGVAPEDVVNSWDLAALAQWARSHEGDRPGAGHVARHLRAR